MFRSCLELSISPTHTAFPESLNELSSPTYTALLRVYTLRYCIQGTERVALPEDPNAPTQQPPSKIFANYSRLDTQSDEPMLYRYKKMDILLYFRFLHPIYNLSPPYSQLTFCSIFVFSIPFIFYLPLTLPLSRSGNSNPWSHGGRSSPLLTAFRAWIFIAGRTRPLFLPPSSTRVSNLANSRSQKALSFVVSQGKKSALLAGLESMNLPLVVITRCSHYTTGGAGIGSNRTCCGERRVRRGVSMVSERSSFRRTGSLPMHFERGGFGNIWRRASQK